MLKPSVNIKFDSELTAFTDVGFSIERGSALVVPERGLFLDGSQTLDIVASQTIDTNSLSVTMWVLPKAPGSVFYQEEAKNSGKKTIELSVTPDKYFVL